ncbi:unnamed protein product, partial [Rotaria sp. Silwood2]
MFLQFVYSPVLLMVVCSMPQLNLYNTDRQTDVTKQLEYDCLYYEIDDKIVNYGEPMKLIYQIIPYCRRPFDHEINLNIVNDTNELQGITFEKLHKLNISSDQLLIWSAPIDAAERYQIYLNNKKMNIKTLSNEVFYNCTWPWFGEFCQYALDYDIELSFNQFVFIIFQLKNDFYFKQLNRYTNLSCYIHLVCNRGHAPLCLDWREICDGRVDCLNDGVDEEYCWQLEINECSKNEYRCHNGAHCIPEKFLHDDPINPDCLDRSDEPSLQLYPELCPADPAFRCEEHICMYSRNDLMFSCGDGQCIGIDNQCTNERSISYLPMDLLSNDCNRMMACLTLSRNRLDDIPCYSICANVSCAEIVRKECPSLFQFPPMYIFPGNVFFAYTNNQSNYNSILSPLPEFVCYEKQLCQHSLPTVDIGLFNNSKCISFSEFGLSKNTVITRQWNDLLIPIKGFFQGCLTYKKLTNTTHCLYSSLYQCSNTLTCISKHRLLDGNQDCYMNDDETFNNSCSLDHQHRFKCSMEDRCISWISVHDFKTDCLINDDEALADIEIPKRRISFQTICDGFQELSFIMINEQNESDETNCHLWPCNTIYSRCDGIWNCLDGADEVNCSVSFCSPSNHMCVSPITNNLTCIPISKANDGIVDCLGGSDERRICRMHEPEYPFARFLCRNHTNPNTMCLQPNRLCNQKSTCSFNDDEIFCLKRNLTTSHFCDDILEIDRTDVEKFLCSLTDASKKSIVYFSLYSDQMNTKIHDLNNTLEKNRSLSTNYPLKYDNRSNDDQTSELIRTWRCNRGIPIQAKYSKLICLCPPSYYGDRCQYQNQRVSLTLQLQAVADFRMVFTIVIILIDDEGQIYSYEHINYLGIRDCSKKFNIYLLYSTRPKDATKNYSIRIDAFTAISLDYHTSWLFPIEFLFLPVNRLAIHLIIPVFNIQIVDCKLQCNHGQCRKYENTKNDFCRCDLGWSDCRCLTKYETPICSSDSVCIGPGICICPLGKYGRQCSLTQSICSKENCQNVGQCVPFDQRIINNQWYCICKEGYSGKQCNITDRKIIVSFYDTKIPLSILIHFIYAPGDRPHERTTTFSKVLLGQNIAIIYSSIHFHLVIIEFLGNYFLTTLEKTKVFSKTDVHIELIATQQCQPIEHLFNNTIVKLHLIQRIKYYQLPCQQQSTLVCFYDNISMCLCDEERYANCFEFDQNMTYNCQGVNYCLNDGLCFQDNSICPTKYICVCTECYYGTRCQLTTKGTSLSLDVILGNLIRPYVVFIQQPMVVKISATVTIIMFILGLVNGFLCGITFKTSKIRQVNCGFYLFVLSIISPIGISMLTIKFWLLILTQMSIISNRSFLLIQCVSIDMLLIVFLRLHDCLSACISLERAATIIKGIYFRKEKDKYKAKWVIIILFILIISTTIHDQIHRYLIDDVEEQRTWCIVNYTEFLRIYDLIINFCHCVIPFGINIISASTIIIIATRKRSTTQTHLSYKQHLNKQFQAHKHLLISPIILI